MFGISPVDVIDSVIDGESVGPDDVFGDEDAAVGTVEIGPFDTRLMAPVGPDDGGSSRVDGDGTRLNYY